MDNLLLISGILLIVMPITTLLALIRGWRWYSCLPILTYLIYLSLWIITFGAVFGNILSSEIIFFITIVATTLTSLIMIVFSSIIISLKPSDLNKQKVLIIYNRIIAPVNNKGVLYLYLFTISIWAFLCIAVGFFEIEVYGNFGNFLLIPSAIISFLLVRLINQDYRRKPIFKDNVLASLEVSKNLFTNKMILITVVLCGSAGIASGYLAPLLPGDSGFYILPGLFFGIMFSSVNISGSKQKLIFILFSTAINAGVTGFVVGMTPDNNFPNPIWGLVAGAIGSTTLYELQHQTSGIELKLLKFLDMAIVGGLLGVLFIMLFNNLSTIQTATGYALWQSMVAFTLLAEDFPVNAVKSVLKKRREIKLDNSRTIHNSLDNKD